MQVIVDIVAVKCLLFLSRKIFAAIALIYLMQTLGIKALTTNLGFSYIAIKSNLIL